MSCPRCWRPWKRIARRPERRTATSRGSSEWTGSSTRLQEGLRAHGRWHPRRPLRGSEADVAEVQEE
eukprot:2015843-Pyramimonas_sp.AAC.1